jgi:hypothetical protein
MSDAAPIALTFRLGKPEDLPSVADAIAAHQDIAQSQGRVALGKTGRALATCTIDRVLADSAPCLLLITRVRDDFHAHSATIHQILTYPQRPADALIPRYYRHLIADIRTWFLIGPITPFADRDLAAVTLCSNGRPLLEILRSTRTANMLVQMRAA